MHSYLVYQTLNIMFCVVAISYGHSTFDANRRSMAMGCNLKDFKHPPPLVRHISIGYWECDCSAYNKNKSCTSFEEAPNTDTFCAHEKLIDGSTSCNNAMNLRIMSCNILVAYVYVLNSCYICSNLLPHHKLR